MEVVLYIFLDNGSTSEDISSLSAGTYTVIVTDNNWGCIDTSVIVITGVWQRLSVVLQSSGSATVCLWFYSYVKYDYLCISCKHLSWNDANGPISGAIIYLWSNINGDL